MELMTAQIARRWRLEQLGLILLDTTWKSGDPAFAPRKQMTFAHKDFDAGMSDYDDAAYTRDYRRMMIESWRVNKDHWLKIINTPGVVVLGCYCKSGKFCHRHLLAGFFKEICEKQKLPYTYYGEFE